MKNIVYKERKYMKTTLVIMAAGIGCSSWSKWRDYHGLFYP